MQKIFKTGNSLAVVVPSEFLKSLGVKAGDSVKVSVRPEKCEIIYKFSGSMQLLLSKNIFRKKK